MSQRKDKVFVYGTLKQGYHNHNRLLSSSKLIAEAVTEKPYNLKDGAFPFMSMDTSGWEQNPVLGEVYLVDSNTMQTLDYLEGVEYDFYTREKINVLINKRKLPVWAYFSSKSVKRGIGARPDCGKTDNGEFVWQ